ncbi:hypothetical protein V1512DRAFT_262123 [Lipomyces arxii]|uniref:uncharacterized protein n=1 Tax=Lipomyces arxii TaxID=56418 RepID=UPI0034CF0461
MPSQKTIQELADDWLELDKNPVTRKQIEDLLTANNVAELERRLRKRIQFGTAGLRAKIEAGFSRMNDLTVLQASQGLAEYVSRTVPDALERGVVIGRDHRHGSEDFARLAACAFITKGFRVHYFDKLVHTPLVPFAVGLLNAACGVMITASHNPAQDNGYKVYWSNGCQIIPPHDAGIAKCIIENLTPWVWNKNLVATSPQVTLPQKTIVDEYYRGLVKLVKGTHFNTAMRFVYSPMHGVGLPYAIRAASLIGAKVDVNMFAVPEQSLPDPDFPTVVFPNPEEAGALEYCLRLSDSMGISLVLSNDPDADRFCAAVKGLNGSWLQLTGNELGILFAYFIYHTERDKSKIAMLTSTASSQLLRSFAETEGFKFEETLTGFKWIGNRALELQKEGYKVPFAFEEAIGYMFEGLYDKDGIAAMLMFIKLLCWIEATISGLKMTRAQGIILCLEGIYRKYGFFENRNSYYVSLDPAVTDKVFNYIRTLKPSENGEYSYPEGVGSRTITYWRDLTVGYESSTPNHVPILPTDKNAEMITFTLDNSVRVTIRGSGTEPKLKVYIEAKSTSRESAREMANEVWDDLEREWFRPRETGLLRP